MDSPRSGFRRAAATSWALAGIGIAGVAGASALAYADTLKPPPSETATDMVDQVPQNVEPAPSPDLSPPPVVTTAEDAPPPPPPVTTTPPAPVTQSPVYTYTPEYTPEPTYVPQTTVQQAPVTRETTAPTTQAPRPTTRLRALTPTTVMAPNFSPRISRSRGS